MLIPKIQFYRQKQVFSVDIVECFVFSYINAITLQSVTTILVLISVPLSDLVVKCTSSLGCFLLSVHHNHFYLFLVFPCASLLLLFYLSLSLSADPSIKVSPSLH